MATRTVQRTLTIEILEEVVHCDSCGREAPQQPPVCDERANTWASYAAAFEDMFSDAKPEPQISQVSPAPESVSEKNGA